VLKRCQPRLAEQFLTYCKVIDRRVWHFQHPLRQIRALKTTIARKLEAKKVFIVSLWLCVSVSVSVSVYDGVELVHYVRVHSFLYITNII